MGRHFLILVAALAAITVTAAPHGAAAQETPSDDETTRIALADQIVLIAYPEDRREAIFAKVIDQMEAQALQSVQNQISDAGAMDILREFQKDARSEQDAIVKRNIPKLMAGFSRAYADIFSANELRDILTFVQTDSGQALLLRSSDVISNPHFAAANQAYMDEITAATFAKIPDLMEKLAAYKAASESTKN